MTSPLRNLPALSLDAAKIANDAAQAKAKQMGIGWSPTTLNDAVECSYAQTLT